MTASIDEEDARRRYAAGESLRDLAARYGVAVATVAARLPDRRPAGRRPRAEIDTAEIVRLHDEEGVSLREIATRYDVAPSTITRRYSRATA